MKATIPSRTSWVLLLFLSAISAGGDTAKPHSPNPAGVLQGLRDFYAKTARPDGSFRPASTRTTGACPTAPTATWPRSPTPSPSTRRSAGSCRTRKRRRRVPARPAAARRGVLQRRRHRRPGVGPGPGLQHDAGPGRPAGAGREAAARPAAGLRRGPEGGLQDAARLHDQLLPAGVPGLRPADPGGGGPQDPGD